MSSVSGSDDDLDKAISKWIDDIEGGKPAQGNASPPVNMNNEHLERNASRVFGFMKHLTPWKSEKFQPSPDAPHVQPDGTTTTKTATPVLPVDDFSPAAVYPVRTRTFHLTIFLNI